MITDLTIRNYQSLQDVTVSLSRFTVIVGPSSSGKSAFTRACKTLTSNARGDSFITHGEQQTTILAKTDKGTVALLRGKKNEYVVIPHGEEQRVYTKLSGTVPEEVSEFIGIPAKDALNYANQFDMPYLLSASAAEVARTLGELTNVSVIYEAAREANRRKAQAASTLKTRVSDYDSVTANLDQYRGLKAKQDAIEQAEHYIAEAKSTQTRILGLRRALDSLGTVPPEPVTPTLPDTTALGTQLRAIDYLSKLIAEATSYKDQADKSAEVIETQQTRIIDAQEAYIEELRAAGVCPTCGQDTTHLHG